MATCSQGGLELVRQPPEPDPSSAGLAADLLPAGARRAHQLHRYGAAQQARGWQTRCSSAVRSPAARSAVLGRLYAGEDAAHEPRLIMPLRCVAPRRSVLLRACCQPDAGAAQSTPAHAGSRSRRQRASRPCGARLAFMPCWARGCRCHRALHCQPTRMRLLCRLRGARQTSSPPAGLQAVCALLYS